MKRRLLCIFISILLVLTCMGCGTSYQEAINSNNEIHDNKYFTNIVQWRENGNNFRIVYANDTNVKYLMVFGGDRVGITPLYNADGTLQINE